jgi:hypothetical protein
MYSDSRKAQRNSFAHHRAELLFSRHRAEIGDAREWAATVHEGTEPAAQQESLRQRLIVSLRGFVPAALATSSGISTKTH